MGTIEGFATAGEQLARRALAKEPRHGVDHFIVGQHGCHVEDGLHFLNYVDPMGHVMVVPCQRVEPVGDHHGWVPLGIYLRAGQVHTQGIERLWAGFKLSAKMVAALEAAK